MELGAMGGDVVEPFADLCLRDAAVGSEVEEVVLLGVELGERGLGLPVEQRRGAVLVGECQPNLGAKALDQLGSELHLAVVTGNGVFDVLDAEMALVAEPRLAGGAEPVEVLPAIPLGPLDDQAGGAALLVASAAEDRALQVVVVLALAFLAASPAAEDLLNSLEGLEVDEGFVSSWVLVALVGDDPDVIRVPEEL